MKNKVLFHGSQFLIEKPEFGKGKPYNDYGLGFYCTENIELAKEWACVDNQSNGYINKYNLNFDQLKVLDLTNKKFSTLNWMAVLVKFRDFDLSSEISRRAKDFLIKNYFIDVSMFDVVVGYRADDSYFKFAKDFLNNTISVEKLEKAMKLGKLGKQVVLISKSAFDELQFVGSEGVDNKIYYTKRISRDKEARADYNNLSSDNFAYENYINDIMRRG